MAAAGTRHGPPIAQTQAVVGLWADWCRQADPADLGDGLRRLREVGIDPCEAVFVKGVRRLEQSGEYAADGALGIVAWVRSHCHLSGGAAAERVEVARQLEQLPQTDAASARGELGYQYVAVMARTAEHVGPAAVRKEESNLLQAAEKMDPGQFVGVAKDFEHRVDAAAALTEANRAHARRYLHLGECAQGAVRLDGLLDAEGGAILRTALNACMPPAKDDDRTPGQRRADALVELCRRKAWRVCRWGGSAPALDHSGELRHSGGSAPRPRRPIGVGRLGAGGDRPKARLRCRIDADHGQG